VPQRFDKTEDPRRAFLIKALAAGLLAGTGVRRAGAQLFGRRPQQLPSGQSVYEATGAATVNGQAATATTRIAAGDRIQTGPGAQLIFVVGTDAFILRENSQLEIAGSNFVVNALRLTTGKLLSVFGRGTPKRVGTLTSTIGVRGTGLYVESDPERSYVCNCYGDIEIALVDDPNVTERVVSKHHDAPKYVVKATKRIAPAPFINHTDVELALIEALVGRKPPFALYDEDYGGARRY
jgi:hypothetical protein